jgi:spectinomycin phosphotransferase
MREPPKLADATIMAALEANYGIPISALSFLPIGANAASAGYRLQAVDGAAYFLKLRARAVSALAIHGEADPGKPASI